MQLSPREIERLLIFSAAELARRRLREGVPLSHPDCVALASDAVMEAARSGASLEQAAAAARGLVQPEQLEPGVRELLRTPVQVEATFGDGSRLVSIEGVVEGDEREDVVPGEVVVGPGPAPSPRRGRVDVVKVSNRGRFTAYLTSHFPLGKASRTLEFDRDGIVDARPLLTAGSSIAIDPGETIELEVTWD